MFCLLDSCCSNIVRLFLQVQGGVNHTEARPVEQLRTVKQRYPVSKDEFTIWLLEQPEFEVPAEDRLK